MTSGYSASRIISLNMFERRFVGIELIIVFNNKQLFGHSCWCFIQLFFAVFPFFCVVGASLAYEVLLPLVAHTYV